MCPWDGSGDFSRCNLNGNTKQPSKVNFNSPVFQKIQELEFRKIVHKFLTQSLVPRTWYGNKLSQRGST